MVRDGIQSEPSWMTLLISYITVFFYFASTSNRFLKFHLLSLQNEWFGILAFTEESLWTSSDKVIVEVCYCCGEPKKKPWPWSIVKRVWNLVTIIVLHLRMCHVRCLIAQNSQRVAILCWLPYERKLVCGTPFAAVFTPNNFHCS